VKINGRCVIKELLWYQNNLPFLTAQYISNDNIKLVFIPLETSDNPRLLLLNSDHKSVLNCEDERHKKKKEKKKKRSQTDEFSVDDPLNMEPISHFMH